MSDLLVPIAISSQLDVTGEERVHAAKFQAVTRSNWVCELPSISGTIPDYTVGDTVSFQYTLIQTEDGQPVTAIISSGSLPDGLSMDSSGLVTGVPSTSGNFTWQVTPISACGMGLPLTDTNIITELVWGLMTIATGVPRPNAATEIWLSDNPLSWPTLYTRSSSYIPGPTGAAYDGGTSYLISTSSEDVSKINAQTPTGGVIITSNTNTSNSGARIYAIDDLVFRSHSAGAERVYAISENRGATWTEYDNGSLYMAGICRLNSGRWIALFNNGPTQLAMWSDQAVPTIWNDSAAPITGTMCSDIASDGITALFIGNDRNVYTTTDAENWAKNTVFPVTVGVPQDIIIKSSGNGVFIVGKDNVTSLYRTINSGSAWATISMGDADPTRGCLSLQSLGSIWVATFTPGFSDPGPVYISSNNGSGFAASTLPYATATGAIVVPVGVV